MAADTSVARVSRLAAGMTPQSSGGRVLQIVIDVETPVTRRGPHHFDFGNQPVIHAQPRAEHIRARLVGNDHLRERLTRRRVQKAALVVDLHRLLDQALVDVRRLKVLDVTQPLRERQAGNVALGLRGNVEIGSGLESFARARDLRMTDSRGEQCARERHPFKAEAIHRKFSCR